jgi:hypothetical protein
LTAFSYGFFYVYINKIISPSKCTKAKVVRMNNKNGNVSRTGNQQKRLRFAQYFLGEEVTQRFGEMHNHDTITILLCFLTWAVMKCWRGTLPQQLRFSVVLFCFLFFSSIYRKSSLHYILINTHLFLSISLFD